LLTPSLAVLCLASTDQSVEVKNLARLKAHRLPAERIPVGIAEDYKPCLAKLANGELLLIGFHAPNAEPVSAEYIFIYRSTDGGKTWSERERTNLLGREPYFSVISDDTIFVSTQVLPKAHGNMEGYTYDYLYRSIDRGKTWEPKKIGHEDIPGTSGQTALWTGRNVLELQNGTLIFGVGVEHGLEYLWHSKDKGKTWDKSMTCKFNGVDQSKYPYSVQAEAVYWQARNGKLLAVCRVTPKYFPALPGSEIPKTDVDHYERMVLYSSSDGGTTWQFAELGSYYGEMYPSILGLKNGPLLFTFTLRAAVVPNAPPLGVQVVLGTENSDGFRFDFRHDRILLDTATPPDQPSGGGFGNTVQLDNGMLVTSYSYRTEDQKTHCEVVRWRLPKIIH
jgi:hypothetical protein